MGRETRLPNGAKRCEDRQNGARQRQHELPHVYWGETKINNCHRFDYLGVTFQVDGSHIPDVKRRVAMARQRAGKLRHIWSATELSLDLKMRLYRSACCSILTYGSEAWTLDPTTCKIINGANAAMVSHITQRSIQEEATTGTRTFDLLRWIRARRLRWVGHILRMRDDRLIKQALHTIYDNRKEGDILMDIPDTKDWQDLQAIASHRKGWRARVHKIKPPDCSTHFTARATAESSPQTKTTSQTDSPGYRKFNPRVKEAQAQRRQARARRRAAQFDIDNEESPDPEEQRVPKSKHKRRKQYPDAIEEAAAAVFSSSSSSDSSTSSDRISEDQSDNDQAQLDRVKRYITRDRHEMFFRPKLKPTTKLTHLWNPTSSLWAAAAPPPPDSPPWAAAPPTPPPSTPTQSSTLTSPETPQWTDSSPNTSNDWNTPIIMGHHRHPQYPRQDDTFSLLTKTNKPQNQINSFFFNKSYV